jgi:hypothetical protein
MRVLQGLVAKRRPVHLSVEPRRLLQVIQSQTGGEPRLFNFTRVLNINYGPELGGADRPDAEGATRQRRFQLSLIDGRVFPRVLAQLPPTGPLSQRIYGTFERPFLAYFQNPHGARTLLVRGRLEEATVQLVELRDSAATLQARVGNQPGLEASVQEWLQAARQAEAELALANDKGAARLEGTWKASEPVQLLVLASANQSLTAAADYDLALIKHEQAELMQRRSPAEARAAWRSAADRWQQHRQSFPGTQVEARLHHARALAMLGEVDAALALLENPPSRLEHWNRQAFLIQARLLKK